MLFLHARAGAFALGRCMFQRRTGSLLFGIGWGLVGICPGPAITALVTGQWPALLFVIAMLVGIKLACWLESRLA